MAKKKSNSGKKSTSNELYYKGKRVSKAFKETVIKTAQFSKKDVSTPAKLKAYYTQNKEAFGKLFDIGLETSPAASSKLFSDFDKGINSDKEFYLETETGAKKSISGLNAKFEIAKVEHTLNVMFEAVYVEFSYNTKLDGTVNLSLPTDEELEEIQDEPVEFINDYLAGYGIKIIVSPEKGKKYKENEPHRKRYSEKVERRYKQFKREYNKERKSANQKRKRRK